MTVVVPVHCTMRPAHMFTVQVRKVPMTPLLLIYTNTRMIKDGGNGAENLPHPINVKYMVLYPRNNTKRVKCRGIFNICTAQQTSLYWTVLTLPLAHFIHIRLADFIRTTTWIYTQLNSRHIITTTGTIYGTIHNIRAATMLVFTEIHLLRL
jgi:hypothetical protein